MVMTGVQEASGLPVARLMADWTRVQGFPLVTVDRLEGGQVAAQSWPGGRADVLGEAEPGQLQQCQHWPALDDPTKDTGAGQGSLTFLLLGTGQDSLTLLLYTRLLVWSPSP